MSHPYHLITEASLLFWPVIPLFWIPVHGLPGLRRWLGPALYPLTFAVWLPWARWVIHHPGLWTGHPVPGLRPLPWLGWPLLAAGCALQTWTALIMGAKIIGLPELLPHRRQGVVATPPFSWCRHPTYLSHHLIFVGALLITGEWASLAVALLDVAVTQLIIVPLEERELEERLGRDYLEYARRVPRLIPRPWRGRRG